MRKYFTFSNILFFLTVIVCIGTIVALFSSFSKSAFSICFSSDTLYLASLHKDLFIDHNSLEGWHLNPSPNFFPDMTIYFLIMIISSSFITTAFIFAIVQYLFLIYLIYRLFKALNLPDFKLVASLSNLILLLFFFVTFFSNDFSFTFYLISNGHHTGAFLMSFFCTILAFEYLKQKKKTQLIYLFIIPLLSIFSDRLFVVLYCIPWLLCMLFYFKVENRKGLLWINILNILTAVIGLTALFYLNKSNYVYVETPHRIMDYSFFYECLKFLFGQMYTYLTAWNFISLILIICLIVFVYNAVISLKKLLSPQKLELIDLYYVLSIIFTLVVFFAPVINGSYTGYDTLRYNIYVFYMLVIHSAVIIYSLIQRITFHPEKIMNGLLLTLLIIAILNIAYQFNSKGMKAYFSYYPKDVEYIDYLASKEKLHCGVGDYWSAKRISMFSKKGIRIYSIYNTTTPYLHVVNENWYKKSRFNFFLSDDIKKEAMVLPNFFSSTRTVSLGNVKLILTPEFTYNEACQIDTISIK